MSRDTFQHKVTALCGLLAVHTLPPRVALPATNSSELLQVWDEKKRTGRGRLEHRVDEAIHTIRVQNMLLKEVLF